MDKMDSHYRKVSSKLADNTTLITIKSHSQQLTNLMADSLLREFK